MPVRPPRPHIRALVVDDEPDIRAVVTTTLQLAGHEVVHVANGYDAMVELTSGRTFDLVLLDIAMPGMSGLEMLERARTAGIELPPVLLVSAVADMEVFRAAAKAGANGFLVKPFLPRELVDKVEEMTAVTAG